MKNTIIILLLNLSPLLVFSQEVKTDAMLFGDVKSFTTNDHIPFATVMVKKTNIGTVADGTGHFKLANLPVGKNIIIAQAMGYKSQEKEVYMEKGIAVNVFFELDDDVLNLEQVVITGTRTEHFIKDVPVRTEVITAKAIENKNACNLYQALEGTPGIRVENQCQYCNFTMVRMQGLGAEHTQVLINGQPMYSGLAGVYGLQQLSTVDIDKIEVVKGAGSALYGSGAVAGAINIVTKEPGFIPSTTIDVQSGRYKTNKYDISSSMRNEKGNIGLKIFAQRYSEGAIDETGTGMTRDEVMNKDGISDRVMTNLTNAGFGIPKMSEEKNLLITPKTKVGELLDKYPQLEAILIELSPVFQKLKNPVIRKTVGKVATLQQAASLGNIPVALMINKLRSAIGQELFTEATDGTDLNFQQPSWFNKSKVTIQFDASLVINSGGNPMQQVFNHLEKINPGEIFLLITPFVPAPIIDLITKKGYSHFCQKITDELIHTFFYLPYNSQT